MYPEASSTFNRVLATTGVTVIDFVALAVPHYPSWFVDSIHLTSAAYVARNQLIVNALAAA